MKSRELWAVGRVGREGECFRYMRKGTELGLRDGMELRTPLESSSLSACRDGDRIGLGCV